jgi:hypothetical protein
MMAWAVGAALVVVVAFAVFVVPSETGQGAGAATEAALRRAGAPFDGLGAWVDMYSWSDTFTGGHPRFGVADIDAMAGAGVQTLYIQGASETGPATVLERPRLLQLIKRAHHDGLSVVVWYLPRLVNPADDLTRLLAIGHLAVQGVAVDMESTDVADIGERNAALITLSQQLRRDLPHRPLGAIVLPATLLEVVNTNYWPDFPYVALARSYNAWLPMVYWTERLTSSGFHDGRHYTADSVTRLREDLGADSAAPVDPIAGVSVDGLSVSDLTGFVDAAKATGCLGGSVYEWPATDTAGWAALRALRA